MIALPLLAIVLSSAFADEDSAAVPHVTEQLKDARIDWTDLRLEVTASGEHTTGVISNVETTEASARTQIGVRFLELYRTVRLTPDRTAGDALDAEDSVGDRIDDNTQLWRTDEVRYHTDGDVHIDASMQLHTLLRPALVSMAKGKHRTSPPTGSTTGLVLDARGLDVEPCLAPLLRSEGGEEVYSGASMTALAAGQRPPVAWVADPADVVAARRSGSAPLFARAVGADGCVLTLSDADAAKIKAEASGAPFLLNGQVVVVTAP